MGFFKKSRGQKPSESQGRPSWLRDGMTVSLLDGDVTLEVVGESFYQDNLWRLAGVERGERVSVDVHAILVPDDDNEYDPNAVSVWVAGLKVGHLSRDDAARYRPGLKALMKEEGQPIALSAVIVGGGERDDGQGMLGIFLSHDPTDFGLPAQTSRSEGSMRTGLGEAQATDEDDSTYDLAWAEDLSEQPVKRIPQLRALLEEKDHNPIERHYMLSMLEEDLYYCRDTFPTALTEYDEVAERHHSELVTDIRGALIEKFGDLPLLETYKQSAIRHQKAHNYETALLWAERGLAMYGEDASRPDWVEDLQNRADKYRAKTRPE